jgi:hypothetical protein
MYVLKLMFNIIILLNIVACSDQQGSLIELKFDLDLFPEGIAIDKRTNNIYLNSLKHNKIVTSNLDGSNSKDFLGSNKYGYLSGFGMTIKGDILYALGNGLTKQNNKSVLLLLRLSTGNLIDSYSLSDSSFRYLNDLTISSKNEIFITDSESHKIYKIQRPAKTIEVFLDSDKISNCNGIAISENDEYLYLASRNGICIIDIETKKLINKPNKEYSGIDGLKYYKGNLYGIVNGWRDKEKLGLFKFKLGETKRNVLKSKRIVEFTNAFKVPTTFDVSDQYIYFIINTQLDNFDENSNNVRDVEKLEPYKLKIIKVE